MGCRQQLRLSVFGRRDELPNDVQPLPVNLLTQREVGLRIAVEHEPIEPRDILGTHPTANSVENRFGWRPRSGMPADGSHGMKVSRSRYGAGTSMNTPRVSQTDGLC